MKIRRNCFRPFHLSKFSLSKKISAINHKLKFGWPEFFVLELEKVNSDNPQVASNLCPQWSTMSVFLLKRAGRDLDHALKQTHRGVPVFMFLFHVPGPLKLPMNSCDSNVSPKTKHRFCHSLPFCTVLSWSWKFVPSLEKYFMSSAQANSEPAKQMCKNEIAIQRKGTPCENALMVWVFSFVSLFLHTFFLLGHFWLGSVRGPKTVVVHLLLWNSV